MRTTTLGTGEDSATSALGALGTGTDSVVSVLGTLGIGSSKMTGTGMVID